MSISNAELCVDDAKDRDHIAKLFEEAKQIQQNSPRLPLAERRAAMDGVSSLEAEAVKMFKKCKEVNNSLAGKTR